MKKNCTPEEVMAALQAPFPSSDIEWRVSHSGISNGKPWAMVLAYVTNRAIQTRLDEVFGPAGWKNRYDDFKEGIICTISCLLDGHWIEKSDGAERTDIESLKGGLSNAMKRAAVQWGIGRYLYKLDSMFVEVFKDKRQGSARIYDKKNKVEGYWYPPQLPDWALPVNERGKGTNSQPHSQKSDRNQGSNSNGGNNKTNQQNQKPAQNNSREGFNRAAATKTIREFLENTGLKEQPRFIIPLFKKINPGLKQSNLLAVFDQGTEEELKMYYNALKPVNDLVMVTNHYKISMEDSLTYAQILIPTVKVESLFSCFLNLTHEHVKEISEFIREDIKCGNLKQIA